MICYIKTSIVLICIMTMAAMANEDVPLLLEHNSTTSGLSKEIRSYIKDGDIQTLRKISYTPDLVNKALTYSEEIENKYKKKKNICCYNKNATNTILIAGSTIAGIECVIGLTAVVLTLAGNPIGVAINELGFIGLGSLLIAGIPTTIMTMNNTRVEKIVQNQKLIQLFLLTNRPSAHSSDDLLTSDTEDEDVV